MTTTSPEAALVKALRDYLQAAFAATSDLASSVVVDEWPEPTDPLGLAADKVVVAVSRGGATGGDGRLGGPVVEKVTRITGASGTVRVEYGYLEVPLTIGLWAWRRALRDDVDLLLSEMLNRPMWETIQPVASTTLAGAVAAGTEQIVSVGSMVDIWPGITLEIGAGTTLERVRVTDVTPHGFVATPRYAHAAGEAVVEVPGRRELAAAGLHLRCSDHLSALAHIVTSSEGVQVLDDAEGGRGSQRQEWRSIRNAVGRVRWSRDLTGVALQQHLTLQGHVSRTGGVVPNPVDTPVY